MLLFYAITCPAQSPAQPVSIGPGGAVKLKAQTLNAAGYQWVKNGSAIAGAVSATYTVTAPGIYTVISYNSDGCASVPADPVTVIQNNALANADLVITKSSENRGIMVNEVFEYSLKVKNNGPDVASSIMVKDPLPESLSLEQLLKPTTGNAVYNAGSRTISWQIPTMENGGTAELVMKVRAKTGGVITNTATVIAAENDPVTGNNTASDDKPIIEIKIPNIFTPNDDGKNDRFRIAGLEYFSNNEISIVNRWGNVVYEKVGYQNDWTANGLADGTYFYVLKVKMANSKWQEFKGYITVMR